MTQALVVLAADPTVDGGSPRSAERGIIAPLSVRRHRSNPLVINLMKTPPPACWLDRRDADRTDAICSARVVRDDAETTLLKGGAGVLSRRV
jgi:hypothetical protein